MYTKKRKDRNILGYGFTHRILTD